MTTTLRATMVAGLLLWAAPAQAQVFLHALGGMTSAAEQKPFVAGGITVRAAMVEISGEVGRMQDILPQGLFDALNELQADFPVKAEARLRNTYGLVTVRVTSPTGPIRPFVGGGAGVAHLQPGFDVTVFGISLGDVFGLASFEAQNKMMWVATGGFSFDLPRSAVEVGYRWNRIDTDYTGFNISGVPVTVHSVYGAIRVRF